jgi:hypothetical protein
MNKPLKESKVEFIRYQITSMIFEQNEYKKENSEISILTNIRKYKVSLNSDFLSDVYQEYKSVLGVEVFGKNHSGEECIKYNVEILGYFKVKKSDFELKKLSKTLPGLLLPHLLGIVRSIILNVSSQSGTGSLMIPLVDLTVSDLDL